MASIRCHLEFAYPDSETATRVLRSVEQENLPYVEARLLDTVLVSDAVADSLASLLRTLDDYLACVSVAEAMLQES